MLELLHGLAIRLRRLRPVAMAFFLVFLTVAVVMVFNSPSHEDNLLLVPAIVGSLWSLSAYALLSTFYHIPRVPNGNDRLFLRITLRLKRFWYWLLGILFVSTTAASVLVSVRLIKIWYQEYIG